MNLAVPHTTPRLARRFQLVILAAIAAPMLCQGGVVEQKTLEHVDHLRGVRAAADAKAIARYNLQMDEAWNYFLANLDTALPVLREQLDAELHKTTPNSLVLLDVGYFLLQKGGAADQEVAKTALFAIDTSSPVIRLNAKELFEFAHHVAATHDGRVLPFIDNAFLRHKVTVFIPQHALRLDETLVCVFLYGVYGEGAEQHLRDLLVDQAVARKVLEILVWLGSPAGVLDVKKAYARSSNYDIFVRMTAYMMQSAGPQGRAALLAVRPSDLDARSREYYVKIRPAVDSTRYESLREQFGPASKATPSDDVVKARLAGMNANFGKDENTHPLDILDATLTADYLIGELVKIRAKTFNRLSDEALSDVEMTNLLINALRYRGKS